MITLMPIAIGVIVANLYYLQPLLHEVKGDFAIGTVATSVLITLVQVGYAAGLAFVVPLGDLFARRRLVVIIFLVAALAMGLGSLVHNFALFAVLTVVVGLSSVGGHILIPFAADLADEGQRGRVVARLMTGLLTGVLLSRTFSGIGAQVVGWRGVYVAAALMLVVMAVALSRVLPDEAPRAHLTYRQLLGDSFHLFTGFRELRRRCWFGAMSFASFSVLWTTLAFQLSGTPFHYSNIKIGFFGLLGIGGLLAANAAGSLADRQRTQTVTVYSTTLVLCSFVIMWSGRHDVWLLALAIFLLDAGAQGVQITNQTIIYGLADEGQRGRITSAYMVNCFCGAAVGSLGAGFTYAHDAWAGVCILGAVVAVLMVVPALLWRPAATSAR
jgi:predicted MFS family arabinose efflux permease